MLTIIAQCFKENDYFGEIGKELKHDRTIFAKKIKMYSYDKKSLRTGYSYNLCKFWVSCKSKKICGLRCTHKSAYKCSLCSECYLRCADFEEDICCIKNRPHYVCNGCRERPKCTLLKCIYNSADAHKIARKTISESIIGILSNEEDIAKVNVIIRPLLFNGQSIH